MLSYARVVVRSVGDIIGVVIEEDELEMGADVAATRFALLRLPGTLPIREMEKAHLSRRFEQR